MSKSASKRMLLIAVLVYALIGVLVIVLKTVELAHAD